MGLPQSSAQWQFGALFVIGVLACGRSCSHAFVVVVQATNLGELNHRPKV
jgi:hypothetical protein